MNHLIYQATNVQTGAFYIGTTGRGLAKRRWEHEWAARNSKPKNCPLMGAALRMYGPAAFRWEVLADNLSYQEACDMEIILIADLQPAYNIALGGSIGTGWSRRRPVVCVNTGAQYPSGADAARALGISQMTVSNICCKGGQTKGGLRFRFADSDEVIRPARTTEQIAETRRLIPEKGRGRKHSPETLERMRAVAKVRGVSMATREAQRAAARKPVVCIETGQIFPTAKEAGEAYGIPRNSVYDLCYKGGATYRRLGLSFKYAA